MMDAGASQRLRHGKYRGLMENVYIYNCTFFLSDAVKHLNGQNE